LIANWTPTTREALKRENHPRFIWSDAYRHVISAGTGVLLMISFVALISATVVLLPEYSSNRTVAALRADRDVMVNDSAPAEVLFARAYFFLLSHQRIEEVQVLSEILARRGDTRIFPSLLFNLGNARLRQAFGLIANEDLSGAIPFVNLAKRDFRRVLELEPDNWNAKYNLDVAMRLVRDYPLGQENEGDTLPASKQLWPDMPGIPEGLP
jgi:mxaK protein